jgi:DNA repair exonuclease SbcCD nuclease subunit
VIQLRRIEEAVDERHVHYVALGDRHSVTDVGGSGRVWYSGAPEVTDYDEEEPGRVLVVTVDSVEGSVGVKPERVGEWRFERAVHAVTSATDVNQLASELDAKQAKDRTVLKLGFEGTLSVRDNARLEDLLEHYGDLFAGLQRWARMTDLAVLPEDSDFEDLGLTGFAKDALDELRDRAQHPGDDGEAARDALALLVRLAGRAES